jgi:hypothetical protein
MGCGSGVRAEHTRAGDGFQRALRSRFQPRLTPGAHHSTPVINAFEVSYLCRTSRMGGGLELAPSIKCFD